MEDNGHPVNSKSPDKPGAPVPFWTDMKFATAGLTAAVALVSAIFVLVGKYWDRDIAREAHAHQVRMEYLRLGTGLPASLEAAEWRRSLLRLLTKTTDTVVADWAREELVGVSSQIAVYEKERNDAVEEAAAQRVRAEAAELAIETGALKEQELLHQLKDFGKSAAEKSALTTKLHEEQRLLKASEVERRQALRRVIELEDWVRRGVVPAAAEPKFVRLKLEEALQKLNEGASFRNGVLYGKGGEDLGWSMDAAQLATLRQLVLLHPWYVASVFRVLPQANISVDCWSVGWDSFPDGQRTRRICRSSEDGWRLYAKGMGGELGQCRPDPAKDEPWLCKVMGGQDPEQLAKMTPAELFTQLVQLLP